MKQNTTEIEQELDVECDACGGQGVIDDGDHDRCCIKCGGTGQMQIYRRPDDRGNR